MFGLDDAIRKLGLAIAKPITQFTESEKDDRILDIVDCLYSGEYLKAMNGISELIDPDESA